MARYNEVLSGRYNRLLSKLFSMKGYGPAPQLAGEIAPTLNFFSGSENRFLEGWNRFGIAKSFAASAANFNQFRFRNPANSGVVAILEKVSVGSNATADLWDLSGDGGVAPADLATAFLTTGARFDSRGNPQSAMSLSFTQAAAQGTLAAFMGRIFMVAGSMGDFILTDIQEFPLLPGGAYHFASNTVNLAQTLTIWWRERIIEDSEKQ